MFLSVPSYRWHHTRLRTNIEFILENYLGKTSVGVAGEPAISRVELETIGANPTIGPTQLRLSLPSAGKTPLRVHDVAGRVVRTLLEAETPAGAHLYSWDGTDAVGRSAPSGVYFVRVTALGETRDLRVVRVR